MTYSVTCTHLIYTPQYAQKYLPVIGQFTLDASKGRR